MNTVRGFISNYINSVVSEYTQVNLIPIDVDFMALIGHIEDYRQGIPFPKFIGDYVLVMKQNGGILVDPKFSQTVYVFNIEPTYDTIQLYRAPNYTTRIRTKSSYAIIYESEVSISIVKDKIVKDKIEKYRYKYDIASNDYSMPGHFTVKVGYTDKKIGHFFIKISNYDPFFGIVSKSTAILSSILLIKSKSDIDVDAEYYALPIKDMPITEKHKTAFSITKHNGYAYYMPTELEILKEHSIHLKKIDGSCKLALDLKMASVISDGDSDTYTELDINLNELKHIK
jgi:hypothetical protein